MHISVSRHPSISQLVNSFMSPQCPTSIILGVRDTREGGARGVHVYPTRSQQPVGQSINQSPVTSPQNGLALTLSREPRG